MASARATKKFMKFAAVPLAIFIVVLIVPFVNGFYYTFTDWNGFKTTKLVGFKNYSDSFADPRFWSVLVQRLHPGGKQHCDVPVNKWLVFLLKSDLQ